MTGMAAASTAINAGGTLIGRREKKTASRQPMASASIRASVPSKAR
jgi:hypothetical protein